MRIGILCLQNVPYRELVARARRLEDLGVDTLCIADHFVNPYAPAEPWLEAWTLLGALAERTSRLGLGTLVSPITLRNPSLLARSAATLDEISGGRAECSLGAGGAPLDHAMTGIEAWARAERNDRFAAAAGIVRSLLDTGRAGDPEAVPGPYAVHGAIVEPHGHDGRRIPFTIGALGPRAIGVAARYADTWNSYGVGTGRSVHGLLPWDAAMATLRERVSLLDAASRAASRAPETIRRSYTLVETYVGYPEPEDLAAMLDDLQAAGIDEVVGYWPANPEWEPRMDHLVALAQAR
jgi:alkanesulfonate monooxygenase SsuD/methylene tetrahydromethanopterin reductase-like flavin-dependent oxidoreductase (luciferase family)